MNWGEQEIVAALRLAAHIHLLMSHEKTISTEIAWIWSESLSQTPTRNPEQENIMTYFERLNPWCIIRPFPDMRSKIVGRFRRRVDAEGHLQLLKRMMPTVPFEIMFDVPSEQSESKQIQETLQP